MAAALPQTLGAYLPVVPPTHGQVVVSDGAGHGLSRQKHHPGERILSGELLPRRTADSTRSNFSESPTTTTSLVPLTVRPPARAIAAYIENTRAAGFAQPKIDLRA